MAKFVYRMQNILNIKQKLDIQPGKPEISGAAEDSAGIYGAQSRI